MPAGRPSNYSPKLAETICNLLLTPMSLREICSRPDMPSKTEVCRWLQKHEAFRDQYARAREQQAEILADEIIVIADDGTNDWMMRQDGDGRTYYELNGENVQRSKLRVDARKWAAGKMYPKKYGDRSAFEITGKDGVPLIPAPQIVTVIDAAFTRVETAPHMIEGKTDGEAE